MTKKRMLVIATLVIVIVSVWMARPWDYLPAQWHPGVPLSIEDPLTPVTRWKIGNLQESAENCLAVLATMPEEDFDYLPLEDYTPVENCPLRNVVRVNRSGIEYSTPFTMSCPLLVRWLMFESQHLQDIAREHMGAEVVRVNHLGTFACRNVYGRESGRRSQHATASAFDVAGFELETGENVVVLEHWSNTATPAKQSFLREAFGVACRYFGTALGPDYNLAHANHFHFDASRFNLCR